MITKNKMRRCQREAAEWVVRLTPGNATLGDLEEFKRWAAQSPHHAQAFAEARHLWAEAGLAGRRVEGRMVSERRVSASGHVSPLVGRRAVLGGLAAAAGAASYAVVRPPLDLWPPLPDVLDADYRTGVGEQRHVTLAGHVSVEMNTRTSIVSMLQGGRTDRIELVSGESVISTREKTFEVVSGAGRAWARHATFNIRRDGGMSTVTCLEGVVQVACGRDVTAVGAREQIAYSGQGLGRTVIVDPALVTAWRSGVLVFHDAPLRDVIAEINRYRQGRIILMDDDLGNRVINARFRLDRIGDAVEKVTNAFDATATSLPGGIVLVS